MFSRKHKLGRVLKKLVANGFEIASWDLTPQL